MVGLGVLNGMLGPTHSIYLCKLCLRRSGVLRDSPLCRLINARSCLNHAWLRQALNILFYMHQLYQVHDSNSFFSDIQLIEISICSR